MQVDFSKNYVCHYMEEISYSKERVTVHPAVNGELKHKSLVVLSDEMIQTVATVFMFLKAIVGCTSNRSIICPIHRQVSTGTVLSST